MCWSALEKFIYVACLDMLRDFMVAVFRTGPEDLRELILDVEEGVVGAADAQAVGEAHCVHCDCQETAV